ncbi:TROVE domain-containing protein [Burkholderia territorii]|uniref:TROVE domain-containing protein n=1 Tax=Burkholderia territorii TaxID=1503055 RepID=UPI000758FC05|nr:TROVE domain-containing protein [Burkholderia territorii]KWA35771.1 TROVE domain-containing protein [Burkholderia territorii]
MKINSNASTPKVYTHEGAPASLHVKPIQQLRRTVMACLLWESNFYESGESIAERIKTLVAQCDLEDVAKLAVEAREDMKLRHAPLLLVREMARRKNTGAIVGKTLTRVIQRADEIAEFLAIYWQDGKCPVSKQVKLGLAGAFRKFDAYQFAKYDRGTTVKLRDALFLSHARPKDSERHYTKAERAEERRLNATPKLSRDERLYRQIADRTLDTPDTWEVALSGGAEKRETFERLLGENKLGYLALLRNLRNMADSGVNVELVKQRLTEGAPRSNALPFRFVAAARAVKQWEPMIDAAMMEAMRSFAPMGGRTNVLVDVSGSMDAPLSLKSDLSRLDAAAALAVLVRGICPETRVFTFSGQIVEVPPRYGMGLIDAIVLSQPHGGTYLGAAVRAANTIPADRLIVITDEQSYDPVGNPTARGYMINVASHQNGVGYGSWTKIDGFSEAVVKFIQTLEAEQ